MAMFLEVNELMKKYPEESENFEENLDLIVSKELSDFGLNFKNTIEGSNVKVEFVTEEDLKEEECLKKLKEKLINDVDESYYTPPGMQCHISKEQAVVFIIEKLIGSKMTYKEALDNYQNILTLIREAGDRAKQILNRVNIYKEGGLF